MFRLLFVIWVIVLTSQSASAGAWLREKGKSFLAYSNLTTNSLDTTYSAYFDYGLSRNMTLGVKLDIQTPLYAVVTGKGVVFMRRPINWGNDNSKWAYELALGVQHSGVAFEPIGQAMLSYGSGFTWGQRNGWVALDARLDWAFATAQHSTGIDATIGLDIGARSKGVLQIYNSFGNGQTSVTIAPSYVYRPRNKKFSYVVGLEKNNLSPGTFAIKIGVWQSF